MTWIQYSPAEHGTFAEFHAENLPSQTTISNAHWISAANEQPGGNTEIGENESSPNLRELELEWKRILKSGTKITTDTLDDLARRRNNRVGKWLVYCKTENVDAVWKDIAMATIRNELGILTKVATRDPERAVHVICVYTKNYLDEEDVMRVREKLRQMGHEGRLYYKPDLWTYLNIYANNPWKLRASRYTVFVGKSTDFVPVSDKTLSMAPLTSANGRKIEQVLRGQLLIEQLNDAERDILSRDLRRILQRRLPLSLYGINIKGNTRLLDLPPALGQKIRQPNFDLFDELMERVASDTAQPQLPPRVTSRNGSHSVQTIVTASTSSSTTTGTTSSSSDTSVSASDRAQNTAALSEINSTIEHLSVSASDGAPSLNNKSLILQWGPSSKAPQVVPDSEIKPEAVLKPPENFSQIPVNFDSATISVRSISRGRRSSFGRSNSGRGGIGFESGNGHAVNIGSSANGLESSSSRSRSNTDERLGWSVTPIQPPNSSTSTSVPVVPARPTPINIPSISFRPLKNGESVSPASTLQDALTSWQPPRVVSSPPKPSSIVHLSNMKVTQASENGTNEWGAVVEKSGSPTDVEFHRNGDASAEPKRIGCRRCGSVFHDLKNCHARVMDVSESVSMEGATLVSVDPAPECEICDGEHLTLDCPQQYGSRTSSRSNLRTPRLRSCTLMSSRNGINGTESTANATSQALVPYQTSLTSTTMTPRSPRPLSTSSSLETECLQLQKKEIETRLQKETLLKTQAEETFIRAKIRYYSIDRPNEAALGKWKAKLSELMESDEEDA